MSRLTRTIIPPILADFTGLALASLLLPPLTARFAQLGFVNSVIMGLLFVLFCLSVYGIKKLEDDVQGRQPVAPFLLEKRTLGALGVLFALFLSLATAYVVGFLDSVVAINRGLLDEPSVTIYLLLTPASWFGLALIYLLVLSSDVEATVGADEYRYPVVSFLSLSGVNLMLVAATAVWQALWSRFTFVGGAALFLAFNSVLNLFLFAPPRLSYLTKNPRWAAVLTWVPLWLYLSLLAAPR